MFVLQKVQRYNATSSDLKLRGYRMKSTLSPILCDSNVKANDCSMSVIVMHHLNESGIYSEIPPGHVSIPDARSHQTIRLMGG